LPIVHSSHPRVPVTSESTTSLTNSPSFSKSRSDTDSQTPITPTNIKEHIATPTISRTASVVSGGDLATSGYRAAEAYVRPSPIYTNGSINSYVFDLRNSIFTFTLKTEKEVEEETPTEIFLPEYHFPRQITRVEVTTGKWSISVDEADCGMGLVQRLRWWHGTGEQRITVRGIKRKLGAASGGDEAEEEDGYLEHCQQQTSKCGIM
jgi:hypothetical protein